MTTRPQSSSTVAYQVHAMIAFTVALAVVVIGELYLPVPGWTRAFLALGTVFLVSATFTLSKSIRDQHESDSVLSRIDQVRVQRLLAEFDPYGMSQNEPAGNDIAHLRRSHPSSGSVPPGGPATAGPAGPWSSTPLPPPPVDFPAPPFAGAG